jgi:hypothetical protein
MNIPLNHYKIPLNHYKIPLNHYDLYVNVYQAGSTVHFCWLPRDSLPTEGFTMNDAAKEAESMLDNRMTCFLCKCPLCEGETNHTEWPTGCIYKLYIYMYNHIYMFTGLSILWITGWTLWIIHIFIHIYQYKQQIYG